MPGGEVACQSSLASSGNSGNEFWFQVLTFEIGQTLENVVSPTLTYRFVSQNRDTTNLDLHRQNWLKKAMI